MLVATLTTMLIQYLAQRAWDGVDPTAAWLRGGSIGMWTTVTAAALFGML
jgi:ABC-2 type transport system permease protein